MGETDLHRGVMFETLNTLIDHFAGQKVYVTGNLLLFYEKGNRRKHVSPDAMIVRGLEMRPRDYYLLWEEGRAPNAVIEITSKSTRKEDLQTKMRLYRDVIKVREYILFDPTCDYLVPRLQGFRLANGQYLPIEFVDGRLPSIELGLELEADSTRLRFRDSATSRYLLSPGESRDRAEEARQVAEAARQQSDAALHEAELAHQQAEAAREQAETEAAELRRRIEELEQSLPERRT